MARGCPCGSLHGSGEGVHRAIEKGLTVSVVFFGSLRAKSGHCLLSMRWLQGGSSLQMSLAGATPASTYMSLASLPPHVHVRPCAMMTPVCPHAQQGCTCSAGRQKAGHPARKRVGQDQCWHITGLQCAKFGFFVLSSFSR